MEVDRPVDRAKVFQTRSRVLANERLNDEHWRLTLAAPDIAEHASPGQFVNLKVGAGNDPSCRRPFTVFRPMWGERDPLGVEIVYRVVGRGTRLMTSALPGDEFDVIGPLGRGYGWDLAKKVHILVGGGCGVAALFALGRELSKAARRGELEMVCVLGFRSRDAVILEREFGSLHGELVLTTDDGSSGRKGSAIEVLTEVIETRGYAGDCIVYASGPEAMSRALVQFCRKRGIPGQLTVEKHMLCGIGGCLTCTCEVDKTGVTAHRDPATSYVQFDPGSGVGYALVCRDGPVFDFDEVILR